MSNRSINVLGYYIWRRIQKDNTDREFKYMRPREYLTGLFISASDIQRYIKDYFEYGIDYFGEGNECADDKIERYWDDADGWEG